MDEISIFLIIGIGALIVSIQEITANARHRKEMERLAKRSWWRRFWGEK